MKGNYGESFFTTEIAIIDAKCLRTATFHVNCYAVIISPLAGHSVLILYSCYVVLLVVLVVTEGLVTDLGGSCEIQTLV